MEDDSAYTYTIGKRPGSKPTIMTFLYDSEKKRILIAWEYASEDERKKMFERLQETYIPTPGTYLRTGSKKGNDVTFSS